jgi:drug/metabolite transporter (DMT)-like permease
VDLALVGVTLVWGINNVALKRALTQFLPLSFNALRFVIATTLVFALLYMTERRIEVPRGAMRELLVAGLLGNALYQVGFIKGLSLSTAGNVSFVLATMPATTALVGHLLGAELLPWRGWLGFGVTLAGCVLIILSGGGKLSFGGETMRGDLIVLGATLGWVFYTILSKRLLTRYSPLALTAWTMGLGTVGLVLLSVPDLLRQDWSRPDSVSWLALVGSASLALVFGYVAWNWGLRQIGTARTAIYGNLSPLWTGFFGWLLLGETWAPSRALGAAMILAGVATVRSAGRLRSRAERASP